MNISELLIIMNRLNYTKSKLVSLGYDKHLTEIEIMHSLKYYRIFGPGNLYICLIILSKSSNVNTECKILRFWIETCVNQRIPSFSH